MPNGYTITKETVTIFIGPDTHTIKSSHPNFKKVRMAALNENWEEAVRWATPAKRVATWMSQHRDFSVDQGSVLYRGRKVPHDLSERILSMADSGESPTFLAKFWENLELNPSWRSVQQTHRFLSHIDISIDDEGYILAYKGVTQDWKDCHTRTISNKVGAVVEEPRNQISDDPEKRCHFGLHAGSLSYAGGYGDRVIIVRIHPRDVVCVPLDAESQKIRVCRYTVVGVHGSVMGVTTDRSEDEALDRSGGLEMPPDLSREDWENLENLEDPEMCLQSVDNLRKYASRTLKIVGASRLRKDALVQKILETR